MTSGASGSLDLARPPVVAPTPAPAHRRWSTSRPFVDLAGWFAAAAGLIALLYVTSLQINGGESDGATVVLEGQAMAAGHLGLHGWALSWDSFWTVDALFYTVAVLVVGVRHELVNFIPALLAALVVIAGALIAREGRRGAAAAAGVVTVFLLLGLPSHGFSLFFLQGPLHIGTALWCLLAFVGLRSARLDRGWLLAVVLLGAGLLGDLQTFTLGVVPVFVGGLLAMARTRNWRSGLAATTAAAASVALAYALHLLARALGGFTLNAANPTASLHLMAHNLVLAGHYLPAMLGVGEGPFGPNSVPGPLQVVHLLGVIAVAGSLVAALVLLVRAVIRGEAETSGVVAPWRLDDVLFVSCVLAVLTFAKLDYSDVPALSRYLTVAVIFGAVLAGRMVARLLAAGFGARFRQIAASLAAAVVLCYFAAFGLSFRIPAPPPLFRQLGHFLAVHGLHRGLGDYWSASIITTQSDDTVTVRPVVDGTDGTVQRYGRQSAADWYAGKHFQFVVYDADLPLVTTAAATGTFGRPAHTYFWNQYVILVWNHSLTVSASKTTS